MHPILFQLGPFTLYTYGAMLVAAFLVSTGLAARAAQRLPAGRAPITQQQVWDFSSLALFGGIIGGRLFYVLLHWDAFAQAPATVIAIWQGGLVWYGGFLGGVLAGWIYVRAHRLSWLPVLDHMIPFVALGHAIGRVGCFLNGCCYGKPTEAWCAVTFPGHSHAVWPTQLFEAGGLVVIFAVLRWARVRPWAARPGRLLGAYLISYAGLRFVIEGFRGDQTVFWAGLTLQQLLSFLLLATGLLLSYPQGSDCHCPVDK